MSKTLFKIANYEDCPVCKGSGEVNKKICPSCDGHGFVAIHWQ